jgi:hypothetical protein
LFIVVFRVNTSKSLIFIQVSSSNSLIAQVFGSSQFSIFQPGRVNNQFFVFFQNNTSHFEFFIIIQVDNFVFSLNFIVTAGSFTSSYESSIATSKFEIGVQSFTL